MNRQNLAVTWRLNLRLHFHSFQNQKGLIFFDGITDINHYLDYVTRGRCFDFSTAGGVLMAKLMNKLSKTPVNPLIGAAGVSAVPMAARVVNKVGLEANPQNHLIMHAMGANVSGVIGSAVAAGVLLALL